MDKIVRGWITEILTQRESLISVAVRQRAKFEGWLKFELASYAHQNGARDVSVEMPFSESIRERSDITFFFDDVRYDLELKTSNSNWRIPGVVTKTRPITKNIAGIIRDGQKLYNAPGQGLVAFVLFPIPPQDKRWVEYLQRISQELGLPLSEREHCSRLSIPVKDGFYADIIICCFSVSKRKKIYAR